MSEPEDADNSGARMPEDAGGKSTEEEQELPRLGDGNSTSLPGATVQPITEAFSQVVALNELPENEATVVRQILVEIGDAGAEHLVSYMSTKWENVSLSLPTSVSGCEEEMRMKWAAKNAVKLLRGFQATSEVFTFKPEVSLESIPTGERRDRAAAIVARVKSEHVSRIEFAVQEAFTNETKLVPTYVLEGIGPSYMENVIRKQFLIARYFDIVECCR